MSKPPMTDLTPDEQPESFSVTLPEPSVPDVHQWRQDGPWLKCRSCPSEHGRYIGVDQHLVGFDEAGQPLLQEA